MSHSFFADLAAEVEIPRDGTLSRVVYRDDRLRIVVFAFDTGQELTEHTASVAALLQVVSGTVDVTVGGESMALVAGGLIVLEPHTPHSVHARTPSILVLTMLRSWAGPS